ncbi:MAG TPA: purine-nucleoside phosphorylase [Chloroflexi bacterium]|nr:purine-nucleoside phosphorylase [Chloroflexota bacterium]HBY09517.1 purine-nucleoside phosphorylase [Chloroflexota bacterium]
MTLAEIEDIAQVVRQRLRTQPRIALILGSGLGSLAESVSDPTVIPYGELPGWPVSTVIGHQGKLVVGALHNHDVIVMQGRVHYYEGYSMDQVTLPVRVMQRLGVEILIVTNAAGAVNPEFEPGDLMLITDHLNMIGMAGPNPLRGPNLDELGPRFPDMSQAYDRKLAQLARDVAQSENMLLHEGVYVGLAGPSFETPADLRFLRAVGVDAVGMSTVPEVTVARQGGQRVLGISGISNKANLDGNTATSHEEVLEAGKAMVPKFIRIIEGTLDRLEL